MNTAFPRQPATRLKRWAIARLPAALFGTGRVLLFTRFSLLRPAARLLLHENLATLRDNFDRAFYLSQIASGWDRRCAMRDPPLHYLCLGQYLGLSPALGFDPRHYRDENPELRSAGNLFLHYLRHGRAEGRTPHPLAARAPPENGPVALALDHQRGGGSTKYLDLYERRLANEGFTPLRLRRLPGRTPQFLIGDMQVIDPFVNEDAFIATATRLDTRRLVMNHYIDLPVTAPDWTRRIAARLGVEYEVILHDYFLACRRIDLIDRNRRYCGLAPVETCQTCLAGFANRADPAEWRRSAHRLLSDAARVVVPSADLATRIAKAFPGIRPEVFEPEDDTAWPAEALPNIAPDEPLRLAVIGSLNVPKGADVIARLARELAARRAPLQIVVLGKAAESRALRRHSVIVTGRYREADIDELLARHRAHAVFFPAIWPETWSFVLSIALRNGLPVIAFDIGAIAARLRRLGRGTVLPYAMSENAAALADALLAQRAAWRTGRAGEGG